MYDLENVFAGVLEEIRDVRKNARLRPKDAEYFYAAMDRAVSALEECLIWYQHGRMLARLMDDRLKPLKEVDLDVERPRPE